MVKVVNGNFPDLYTNIGQSFNIFYPHKPVQIGIFAFVYVEVYYICILRLPAVQVYNRFFNSCFQNGQADQAPVQ